MSTLKFLYYQRIRYYDKLDYDIGRHWHQCLTQQFKEYLSITKLITTLQSIHMSEHKFLLLQRNSYDTTPHYNNRGIEMNIWAKPKPKQNTGIFNKAKSSFHVFKLKMFRFFKDFGTIISLTIEDVHARLWFQLKREQNIDFYGNG